MATPKYKTSKASASSRKAANMKLSTPSLTTCPQCGTKIRLHHVCPKCGYYKGIQFVNPEE